LPLFLLKRCNQLLLAFERPELFRLLAQALCLAPVPFGLDLGGLLRQELRSLLIEKLSLSQPGFELLSGLRKKER
jgi:hypothetical protein